VELTQPGQLLLQDIQHAFDALEHARMRIEAWRGLERGRLTVGASDTTACYILPPALRAFRRRYPRIEIIISNRPSPVTLQHVLAHEVDLGIVTLPVSHPSVVVTELLLREDVVICSPRNSLAARKRMRVEELGAHPLLLLDRGSNTRSFIDERLRKARVAPHVAMELGSIEVIKRLVQLDFGVSIVPQVAVTAEVERGALCAIPVFNKDEARRLGAIHLRKGFLSPAAQEFLRALVGSRYQAF
jgi:DNA-binding transcriptional LysR family regulator